MVFPYVHNQLNLLLFSATIEQKANLPKQRPQNIDFLVNEKLEEKLTSSFFVWLA